MMDCNVDGHFISAPTAKKASDEAYDLYGYLPESVTPWADDDQDNLDEETAA